MVDLDGQAIPVSVPKKLAALVAYWDDERGIGNSLIVTTKEGFAFDPNEKEHVRGFDTVKEAITDLHDVVPCTCAECLKPQGSNT
ncbi:hypothetical protein A7981_05755 [Methylovorus sp. MM2]|nr:hypothetical protein A7981_05755 [Methylovorus sp. MM2]